MASRRTRLAWLALLALLAQFAVLAPGAAAADPQPTAASVPGSFGGEVGCPGDWQPECAAIQLAKRSNDDVWSASLTLPAGAYEYKAALNKTWDVSYGLHAESGGANIPLVVPAGGATVTFFYDQVTHWVTADLTTPIITAAGSFQSELGCPAAGRPTACAPGCRTRTATARTPSPPPRFRPVTMR